MKKISYIDQLESEAIFVIREATAVFEKPVLLFSGGKDSLVMLHIAMKAFHPAPLPFPVMHIDTGHNFPETILFRDALVAACHLRLIVASVQESIDSGRVREETGVNASRNYLQTTTLLDAIEKYHFDVAFGGGRRDEEKARAKERFFSHRNAFGQWDPKNQRPELWYLFNDKKHQGEHFRVFPLSNWTEKDIWQYICNKNIEVPSLYFSHLRECFYRDGVLLAKSEYVPLKPDEKSEWMQIRFRTIGDMTCTGATISNAATSLQVLDEINAMRITERGGRFDDKRSETAMEDRKKEGYF